jgi:formate/nitrite transporter FocA (FNT family)
LFTENTLTPILPLLRRKDRKTLHSVARLWGVVLAGNLVGAAGVSALAMLTPTFQPDIRQEFIALAEHTTGHGFGLNVLKGILAGWLIALIVWMLPYAESAHFWVIVTITWLVGVGGFNHVVAGAVDAFALTWTGHREWLATIGGFLLPTLIGNIIGGVALVAALSHAQVAAGRATDATNGRSAS